MSKRNKILWGFMTIIPLILTVVFVFFFFISDSFEFNKSNSNDIDPSLFLAKFTSLFILMGIISIIAFFNLVYFLVHMIKNERLDSTMKVVYPLLLVMVGSITAPIYWYLEIWTKD